MDKNVKGITKVMEQPELLANDVRKFANSILVHKEQFRVCSSTIMRTDVIRSFFTHKQWLNIASKQYLSLTVLLRVNTKSIDHATKTELNQFRQKK
jgi:hypothetical protein